MTIDQEFWPEPPDLTPNAREGRCLRNVSGMTPEPWRHGSLDYNGHLISYWWFVTAHGKKEVYFDTGISSDTAGVAEQESAPAQYMRRMAPSVKLQ